MKRTEYANKKFSKVAVDQIVGAENTDALSSLDRDLTPVVDRLKQVTLPQEELQSLWSEFVSCLTRLELSRLSPLTTRCQRLVRVSAAGGVNPAELFREASAGLSSADKFLLEPLFCELEQLCWGCRAGQALADRQESLVNDTLAAVARLLIRPASELEFLKSTVSDLLVNWADLLTYAPGECQYQFCAYWAQCVIPTVDCGFQDWRVLMESISLALSLNLDSEVAFGLSLQIQRLTQAIPQFEFVALLGRQNWDEEAANKVRAYQSEILMNFSGQPFPSPLIGQIFLSESPFQGDSPGEVQAEQQRVLQVCRPLCERSWLDWIDSLFERIDGALRWRQWQTEYAESWKSVCHLAVANLAEGLEQYRKAGGAQQMLASIFETANQASLLQASPAMGRTLFRRWFVSLYAVREGQGQWLQAKAVVRSVQTQLKRAASNPWLNQLQAQKDLVEMIPAIVEEAQSEVISNASQFQALLSYGEDGLGHWLAQQLQLRGPESLCNFDLGSNLEPTNPWLKGRLAGSLWQNHRALAESASHKVYARLEDYSQESGANGQTKCARDLSALTRKVAWCLLARGDGEELLKDWWRDFVDTYLVHRHQKLMGVTLEALLDTARTLLTEPELQLFEAYLSLVLIDPVLAEDVSSGAIFKPDFRGIVFRFPLERKRPAAGLPSPVDCLDWNSALQYAEGYASGVNLSSLKVEMLPIFNEGWSDFSWVGALGNNTCRALRRWCESHKDQAFAFERMIVGLLYASDSSPFDVLPYLQALQEFGRQCFAGLELQSHAESLAIAVVSQMHEQHVAVLEGEAGAQNASKCQRDLQLWLEQLALQWQTLPAALAQNEFRRYLVDCVGPFIHHGQKTWRLVWQLLAAATESSLTPATHNLLLGVAQSLQFSGAELSKRAQISRRYATTTEPVFSPNPSEEQQWRQLVGSLLALELCIEQSATDWVLLCLTESLSICHTAFEDRFQMVLTALWGEVPSPWALRMPVALQQRSRLVALGDPASLEAGVLVKERTSCAQATAGRWGRAPLLPSSFAAAAWTAAPKVVLGQMQCSRDKCERDLGWVHRRLWAESLYGPEYGSAAWFAWEVAPYASSVAVSEHQVGLRALVVGHQWESGPQLRAASARLWSALSVGLIHEELTNCPALRGRRDGSESFVCVSAIPTDGALSQSLPKLELNWQPWDKKAREYAIKNCGDWRENDTIPLLTLLSEELASFEDLGFLSSRLTLAFSRWSTRPEHWMGWQRYLIGLLYVVAEHSELPLTSRLRLIDYLQACIEFTRQFELGYTLKSKATELAKAMAEELHAKHESLAGAGVSAPDLAKCQRDFNLILSVMAECLASSSRPVALLNIVRYLTAEVAPFVGYSSETWNAVWNLTQRYAEGSLGAQAAREFSWWSTNLKKVCVHLGTVGVLADSLRQRFGPLENSDPRLSVRGFWNTLLSLRLIQETQVTWMGNLRRFVSEFYWGSGKLSVLEGSLTNTWAWIQESFIEFDLRPLETEVQVCRRGWSVLSGVGQLLEQSQELSAKALERLPVGSKIQPNDITALMLAVVRLDWTGEFEASRWSVPTALKLLDERQQTALAALGADISDRLRMALVNLLSRYVELRDFGPDLGKLFDMTSRVTELERAWSAPLDPDLKGVSAGCLRDLGWLGRRVFFEAWCSSKIQASASLNWYRWEVVPFAKDISPKMFLQASERLLRAVEKSDQLTQAMKRGMDEFHRQLEDRFDGVQTSATAIELMLAPRVDRPARANKPEKRSWWGRISESFEGIVGGGRQEN